MSASSLDGNLIKSVWQSREAKDLASWAMEVSDTFFSSGLSLSTAAKLAEVRQAEFLAALQLASLESSDLMKISAANPPRTTWLSLAKASSETIDLCIQELANKSPRLSAVKVVADLVRSRSLASSFDKVGAVKGSTLIHFGKKAKEYGSLSEKNRDALISMGRKKSAGALLTAAQKKYITDLLKILVSDGVISSATKDNDEAECAEVLSALNNLEQ
jgi:hypothetical protein